MNYPRLLNISEQIKHRSLFLLGPRQTGKTTLIESALPDAQFYSLLRADTFQALSSNPSLIREQLGAKKIIVIDEIQKMPSLLDEVHFMIEAHKELRFVLTGSSARKLKRGGANLLAGRAWVRHLHPLVFPEIGHDRLLDRLNRGSLPSIVDSAVYWQDLQAYVGTYLQEEIRAEGLTRSIENFSRFLNVAGLTNGEQVNLENVGRDSGVPARTIREFYQIIIDTLLGYFVEPYTKGKGRKSVSVPKFYLFDVGVANFLQKRKEIVPGSKSYGDTLEHVVFLELRAYLDYYNRDEPLNYWRSTTKFEVDFIVGDSIAVEIKGKHRVQDQDLKGLRALKEEKIFARYLVVCDESQKRVTSDGIEILPLKDFFEQLWNKDIIV